MTCVGCMRSGLVRRRCCGKLRWLGGGGRLLHDETRRLRIHEALGVLLMMCVLGLLFADDVREIFADDDGSINQFERSGFMYLLDTLDGCDEWVAWRYIVFKSVLTSMFSISSWVYHIEYRPADLSFYAFRSRWCCSVLPNDYDCGRCQCLSKFSM